MPPLADSVWPGPVGAKDDPVPIRSHPGEPENLDGDAELECRDPLVSQDGDDAGRYLGFAFIWQRCHWQGAGKSRSNLAVWHGDAHGHAWHHQSSRVASALRSATREFAGAAHLFPKLHRHHRAFIELSPFAVIASADRDGAPDVSPRGDLPGFAAVLDDQTIVLPDRPGNKKLMTLTNVLENPAVSLIFFVPGRTESLRISGRARITTDPALLLLMASRPKPL